MRYVAIKIKLIIRNCTTSYIFSPFFCLDTKAVKPELKKARFAKMFETHFG